jgi:TetR/AcrR family tetracycline transcriptional repressor
MVVRRDDVVRTALELLDESGLDGLTTRVLTARLGLQRGALYWHVRSKAELLAAMADEVMRPAFAAPASDADAASDDWAEQARGFARRTRRAMLAHRDGARLVAGHLPMTERVLAAAEDGLTVLRGAGVPLAWAAYCGDTIASYVTGFTLQEQAATASARPGPDVDPATFPNLAAWWSTPHDQDTAFEAGLTLIVDGLRSTLARVT